MQVRRVWPRAARSLLAQRTRAVPVKAKAEGRAWRWRWSLGTEPNEAAVLEARQYLAADLDVEAVYLNTAYYGVFGARASGMWEPDEESYDPHGLAKQRLVTTPSLGVEVRLAVSARWMDRAHRGRRLAVKLGKKTRASAEPLARKGYRAARDRVAREWDVKHLRRASAPAPDLSGTRTAQVSLMFNPEPGVDPKLFTEQLIRAGVLRDAGVSADDAPEPKVDGAAETKSTGYVTGYVAGADVGLEWSDLSRRLGSDEREPDPRRCIDPDNTVHLVHPYLALPLCGKPLKHEERAKKGGGRVFFTVGAEGMADDSRMCDVCARMSAALSEPPVDPELWRSASPVEWEENNQLFAEALGPSPADEEADFEALRDRSRVVDREGVLHLTSEPFPASLTKVVPHCGRRLEIASGAKYFEALAKRGDPTPAGARSICMNCVEAPESMQTDSQQELMAQLKHVMRLVSLTGTMHIARMLMTDEADLQRSQTYCGFESGLRRTADSEVYQSAAKLYEPTPVGAVRICGECVRQRQPEVYHQLLRLDAAAALDVQDQESAVDPEPAEAARPDTSPELDDGDEMPVLKVASDAKVYLPRMMVEAGMAFSQKNAARLIKSGYVTIDDTTRIGKLTYRAHELVGFVVELRDEHPNGPLPRIYESMTRRFRVSTA